MALTDIGSCRLGASEALHVWCSAEGARCGLKKHAFRSKSWAFLLEQCRRICRQDYRVQDYAWRSNFELLTSGQRISQSTVGAFTSTWMGKVVSHAKTLDSHIEQNPSSIHLVIPCLPLLSERRWYFRVSRTVQYFKIREANNTPTSSRIDAH